MENDNAKCRMLAPQCRRFWILHSSLYILHSDGVPSRTLTSNLEFRTLPLCVLSYGDRKPSNQNLELPVGLAGSVSVAPRSEESSFLLPVKPAKELLKPRVGLNLFDRVELVAQFVMGPGLVDEILAGMAGRSDVAAAFAARHNMVPSRGHLPFTKCACFVHTAGPTVLLKHIHIHHRLKVSNPWLVSSTNSPPRH